MEVSYIQLVKIDHDNNNVVVEPIDEQENIKHYVMDMLATISENVGEREYIFKDGEETMKTYLNSFIKEDNKDEITLNIAKRLLSKEKDAQIKYAHITQIQKGIMLASLCKMTDRDYKVIIVKADYSEFLEEASGEKRNGLPTKKKIFKSFIANATIVGMKPMDDQSVVKDLSAFHKDLVVADAVYNPIETKLLREAKEAGCKCVGGKGMLLWQGVAAFKLYTGMDMPVEEVKARYFS